MRRRGALAAPRLRAANVTTPPKVAQPRRGHAAPASAACPLAAGARMRRHRRVDDANAPS